MQISASGVLTAMYRQDVFANNLANTDTVGFKPDVTATRQRPAVREEDGVSFLPSNALLERLGGGVLLAKNRVDFGQGPLERTSNPLDLAIEGEGFFVVRDEADRSGDRLRLTRDGRFTRDQAGRLVMSGTGLPVLDAQNRPIVIPSGGDVTVSADGVLRQGGADLARLAMVRVPNPDLLEKQGAGLFKAPREALSSTARATGTVRQGYVEQSSADEIRALLAVTSAAREVDSNIGMIQQQDRMLDRAINTLGRIST